VLATGGARLNLFLPRLFGMHCASVFPIDRRSAEPLYVAFELILPGAYAWGGFNRLAWSFHGYAGGRRSQGLRGSWGLELS
jgi:hypothetical protein